MPSTALTASGLTRLQCGEGVGGRGSLSWAWALGNCRVNCQNQFVLIPHNSKPAETCFYGLQASNWPQVMEVISKEVFIVTNLGCVPSQHLFLKQVEFKEPWRRKAVEETYQSHLTVLETALLAHPWQGSWWDSPLRSEIPPHSLALISPPRGLMEPSFLRHSWSTDYMVARCWVLRLQRRRKHSHPRRQPTGWRERRRGRQSSQSIRGGLAHPSICSGNI